MSSFNDAILFMGTPYLFLVEFDPAINQFVGSIPEIVGVHTQALTLPELYDNLRQVLELHFNEIKKNTPNG